MLLADLATHPDLADRAAALSRALGSIPDPQARFAWVVEQARSQPALPATSRRDEFRVQGCQVRLWWVPEYRDGRCWFRLDSDALSLKAVAGLVCAFYDGQAPADILGHPPEFLQGLHLGTLLAESRRRTVGHIHERILDFARQHVPPA